MLRNSMLRSILGARLTDRRSLEDIYMKTRARKVGVIVKILKYKYAGHLARDNSLKWNKILTTWVPHKQCRQPCGFLRTCAEFHFKSAHVRIYERICSCFADFCGYLMILSYFRAIFRIFGPFFKINF